MHYFCKSAIILITYLLLATTLKAAEGGGHTVGNGGDLSELYIIEIWLNLDKKIEYCFESTDPCQLLATEKNEIKFLLNHFNEKGDIHLKASANPWEFKFDADGITFNKKALYNNETPKSYGELQALVLKALLLKQTGDSEFSQLLAEKLKTRLFLSSFERHTFFNSKKYSMHWTQFTHQNDFVAIDSPEFSFEISNYFLKTSPCEIGYFQLQRVLSMQVDYSGIYVKGDISYICTVSQQNAVTRYRGKFYLNLPFDSNHGFDTNLFNVSVYQLELLNEQ